MLLARPSGTALGLDRPERPLAGVRETAIYNVIRILLFYGHRVCWIVNCDVERWKVDYGIKDHPLISQHSVSHADVCTHWVRALQKKQKIYARRCIPSSIGCTGVWDRMDRWTLDISALGRSDHVSLLIFHPIHQSMLSTAVACSLGAKSSCFVRIDATPDVFERFLNGF